MGPHVRHYVTPAREKPFIKLPIFAVYTRFAKSGQAIATRKFCEARRRPLMAGAKRKLAR
jgi:hypothetical protein